jgi:hypothetical protein
MHFSLFTSSECILEIKIYTTIYAALGKNDVKLTDSLLYLYFASIVVSLNKPSSFLLFGLCYVYIYIYI